MFGRCAFAGCVIFCFSDLRRFFGIFGYCNRNSATVGNRFAAQFCFSVFFARYCRILAALAYFPFILIQRLSVLPLGGSKGGTWMKIRNTFAIFLMSGFWHGANWTFIVWGFLNALYFIPLLLTNRNRNNMETVAQRKLFPTVKEFFQMFITFALTVFAWIFFRAENMTQAMQIVGKIFSPSLFSKLDPPIKLAGIIEMLVLFFVIEWLGRENQYAIEKFGLKWNKILRYTFYCFLILTLFWFGGKEQQFIYFQF